MDIAIARSLSKKLQISPDFIVREEYEMLILREIFESKIGIHLVFKGGTALRLAYGSPRFSEDLDFTLLKEFDQLKFIEFINRLGKIYPTITDIETTDKHYTNFALLKIREPFLDRAFSIKIEISKRNRLWKRDKDYSLKLIKSETTPLAVLANIAGLKVILREKKDALKNRKVARDIFDYWYIHQILKKNVEADFSGFDKSRAKSELHRLLPKNYWRLIDPWLE